MRRVALIVLLSIAVAAAADKDKRFAPKAAKTYPGHQTFNKITIAAVPYTSEDQAKSAFDKARPYKYGFFRFWWQHLPWRRRCSKFTGHPAADGSAN